MSSKLRNTEAIRNMLAGEHRTQTKIVMGFEPDIKKEQTRLIGQEWVDEDGNTWEQKDGYKIKKGKLDELRTELHNYPNCYEVEQGKSCTKNQFTSTHHDLKMKNLTGRCLDCQISFEHKLKLIPGEYEKYEKQKIYENALSWLKEAEKDKELIKEHFRTNVYIPNPDGNAEKWIDSKSYEERCQEIDQEFEKFKTGFLSDLEKELNIN